VTQGPGAGLAVIVFALSFLIWPAMHGVALREAGAIEFFGIFQVLPAIAGGMAGLALHRLRLHVWWFVASAAVALALLEVGPPR
jgi:hypothetical protein